jgi:hypothetical protein
MAIMEAHPRIDVPAPRWTRRWAVLLAWVLAAAWGSVVQTQWNVQALVGVGVDISAAERARMTWQDLIGFAPVYGGILAVGWLLALPVASWLARGWPAGRSALLAVAAGLGMVTAVRAVDALAPMPVFIDATRHLPGLLAMASGAVLAGLLYARLTTQESAPS